MKRIYVACPYTGTSRQQEYRFNIVTKYAADLITKGEIAFSPITHCHPIAKIAGLPGDFNYWKKFNEDFIRWCDEVHVLCLDGWQASNGVNAEIRLCRSFDKPVSYMNPDGTTNEQATR